MFQPINSLGIGRYNQSKIYESFKKKLLYHWTYVIYVRDDEIKFNLIK